jgi:hypothetical protein
MKMGQGGRCRAAPYPFDGAAIKETSADALIFRHYSFSKPLIISSLRPL